MQVEVFLELGPLDPPVAALVDLERHLDDVFALQELPQGLLFVYQQSGVLVDQFVDHAELFGDLGTHCGFLV